MPSLCGHVCRHFTPVARKHYRGADTQTLERGDCRGGILLDAVVDDDMPGITSVHRHVDDRADAMAVVPPDSEALHHLPVADADRAAGDIGLDALSGDLPYVRDPASVAALVGKSRTERLPIGWVREVLHVGRPGAATPSR